MRESPRIRRLRTDLKSLDRLREESTIFDFRADGDPPESYLITFRGTGLYRPRDSARIAVRDIHEVLIRLGASYPRVMPEMEWRTPIFHPNISGSGVICLGGYGTYWVPSLNLDELCDMLWDMVRFQNFDPTSPYNREAAHWIEVQREYELPVDPRPIRDRLSTCGTDALVPETENEILFIDESFADVVDTELVDPEDPDLLIID